MTGVSVVLYGLAVVFILLAGVSLLSQRVAERVFPWWVLVGVVYVVLLVGDGAWWRLP